jgi:serine/threonine-protein kinase
MSVVWRARDEILRRTVAVKVLRSEQASDPARSTVLAEARATASVSHPNVASVFDYGEWVLPDGSTVPYVVMELLAGPTLAQRLDSGPIEIQAALRIATEIAAGLTAAHDVGLVHRDVKPSNVILSPTGAKIVDFGIAAVAGEPDGVDTDGDMMGTLAYVAPERMHPGVAGPAADIYAWGILLGQMVTGRPPWPADVTPAQRAGLIRQAEPLPAVPVEVDRVYRRCLEPDPNRRPTAREVAAVVSAAAGIQLANDVLPADGLSRASAVAVTAHLTPRLPARKGSGFAAGQVDTATYPVESRPFSSRIRRIGGAALLVATAAALLAALVVRNLQAGSPPVSAEPGDSTRPVRPSTQVVSQEPPTEAAPVEVGLTSAGGSVLASCDSGVVLVHAASPASGFELHDGIPGPGSIVEVRFRNDSADIRMIISCVDGVPTYTLKN